MINLGILIKIVILIVLIILSNYFSAAETAMTAVNEIRIRTIAEDGDERAKKLLKILSQNDKMLSTVLICNNVVNLSASALTTSLAIELFGNAYVGLATGILTLLIIVFGEIAPKTRAIVKAEKISLKNAGFIYFLIFILTPINFVITAIAKFFVRLGGTDPDAKSASITEDELRTIVDVSQKEGVIEKSEKEMINNVVDFGDTEAKDIMIPWIDVTAVPEHATYDELIAIFQEEKFTRLPVYEETSGRVVGIINMKNLLLVDREQFKLPDAMREPYFALEHKNIASLLPEMRKNGLSMVIVIDEYGMNAGLITLENVVEEIVGDISDEYEDRDDEELTIVKEGREYYCVASMTLDDLNEKTGLNLEAGQYDSVGGYILDHSEDNIPKVGEYVTTEDGVKLTVKGVETNRITKVHILIGKIEA